MIGVNGTSFYYQAMNRGNGTFEVSVSAQCGSDKKACFERAFGNRGPNFGSLIYNDEIQSGYSVLWVSRNKLRSRIIFDFIEDVSYDGLIDRISQLGRILTDAQDEKLKLRRELSEKKHQNYWCRGSLSDCSVCFEQTYSRMTCGHHLCGACLSSMMRSVELGGVVKCPECRINIDNISKCYHGDDLSEHLMIEKKKTRELMAKIAELEARCDSESFSNELKQNKIDELNANPGNKFVISTTSCISGVAILLGHAPGAVFFAALSAGFYLFG